MIIIIIIIDSKFVGFLFLRVVGFSVTKVPTHQGCARVHHKKEGGAGPSRIHWS
jgi:hypothetical protein